MSTPNEKNIKVITYFLGFMVFVLLVVILITFKDILIPITIAIFLTYLFHPLLEILRTKLRVPKIIALIFIFILSFAVVYLMGLISYSSFGDLSNKIPYYGDRLSIVVQDILKPFNLTLRELEGILGFHVKQFDINHILKKLFDVGIIQGFFSSFSNLLSNFFVVMIFWVFMIMGKEKFEQRLKVAFAKSLVDTEKHIRAINDQLQSYLIIKTLVSLATGITFTVILTIYGVDFALIWGLLAFILNYIPNIGSLIAVLLPILIALLDYGFGFASISLAALLLITQNIFGNVVEPKFLGEKMDLSPVFILFSLIFWGWIWGIVGMFLAVPIASLIKILCSNIDALKPVAILMSSKVENQQDK